MNDTKTILLIGRTGHGKSTLANVLLGRKDKDGNFEETFGESAGSVSKTKNVQIEEFDTEGEVITSFKNQIETLKDKIKNDSFNTEQYRQEIKQLEENLKEKEKENIKYRIVDTVGVGDTSMSLDKVLRKLALMGYSVKDGVSQILFVTDGQLVRETKATYDLLKTVVFSYKEIVDNKTTYSDDTAEYTTIVRTNFEHYHNDSECKNEREKMIERSDNFGDLIKECNDKKIVYVDNPPVDISNIELKRLNIVRREKSRKILLDHLNSVCQGNVYKPKNLDALKDVVGNYEEDKKKK